MLLNHFYKFIVLLPPRCSSHSIKNTLLRNIYTSITKHTPTPNKKTHHHTLLQDNWFDNIQDYVIFLPYRPLVSWIKSCYSNYATNFENKIELLSIEDFILNNRGVDNRYGSSIQGFDWFGHSPQNMLLKNGKLENFKEIIPIKYDNYHSELYFHINRIFGPIPPFKKEVLHRNAFHSRMYSFDPRLEKVAIDLCCPLGKDFEENLYWKINGCKL